jgi:hypothetical protein
LQNRSIRLTELLATGQEIAAALEKKHGKPPQTFNHSLEMVDGEIEKSIALGSPLAALWWYRKVWGTGQHTRMMGTDVWEVDGYPKLTLEELIVEGKLKPYRDVPPQVNEAVKLTFC